MANIWGGATPDCQGTGAGTKTVGAGTTYQYSVSYTKDETDAYGTTMFGQQRIDGAANSGLVISPALGETINAI